MGVHFGGALVVLEGAFPVADLEIEVPASEKDLGFLGFALAFDVEQLVVDVEGLGEILSFVKEACEAVLVTALVGIELDGLFVVALDLVKITAFEFFECAGEIIIGGSEFFVEVDGAFEALFGLFVLFEGEKDAACAEEGFGIFAADEVEIFFVILEGSRQIALLFKGFRETKEGGFVFGEDLEGLLEVVLCFGGFAHFEGDLAGLFVEEFIAGELFEGLLDVFGGLFELFFKEQPTHKGHTVIDALDGIRGDFFSQGLNEVSLPTFVGGAKLAKERGGVFGIKGKGFAEGLEGEEIRFVAFFEQARPKEEVGVFGVEGHEVLGDTLAFDPFAGMVESSHIKEGDIALDISAGRSDKRFEFFCDFGVLSGGEEVGKFLFFVARVVAVKLDGLGEEDVGFGEAFLGACALGAKKGVVSKELSITDFKGFFAFFPETFVAFRFFGEMFFDFKELEKRREVGGLVGDKSCVVEGLEGLGVLFASGVGETEDVEGACVLFVGLCECLHGGHAFVVLFLEIKDFALEVGDGGMFGFALLEFL